MMPSYDLFTNSTIPTFFLILAIRLRKSTHIHIHTLMAVVSPCHYTYTQHALISSLYYFVRIGCAPCVCITHMTFDVNLFTYLSHPGPRAL